MTPACGVDSNAKNPEASWPWPPHCARNYDFHKKVNRFLTFSSTSKLFLETEIDGVEGAVNFFLILTVNQVYTRVRRKIKNVKNRKFLTAH